MLCSRVALSGSTSLATAQQAHPLRGQAAARSLRPIRCCIWLCTWAASKSTVCSTAYWCPGRLFLVSAAHGATQRLALEAETWLFLGVMYVLSYQHCRLAVGGA